MDVKWSNFCDVCGTEKNYNSKYDSYYCILCNTWLEKTCSDPDCDFCVQRPEKPSTVEEPLWNT